jgi:hypothetical protein
MNKSSVICFLLILSSATAFGARGRKIASVEGADAIKDCSAAINFKSVKNATAAKILKAKGFKGDFKNTEIETAKVSFRMTLDQPTNEDLDVKTDLSELVIFDSTGNEVWHSAIKPCGASAACQASVVKQAPICKNGKLVIK